MKLQNLFLEVIMKSKYVPVDGCPFCTNGYNSVPCVICGGLGGGDCINPECVDGEVAVACPCNELAYVQYQEVA